MPRLPVYVRDLPDGRVTATLVDFPEVSVDGAGVEQALAALEPRAAARVPRVVSALRYALFAQRDLSLSTVAVVATPKGPGREAINVRVTVVSWSQPSASGAMFVVRVPGVPAVDLAVSRRAEIETAARSAIASTTREWYAAAVLGLDEPALGRLAEVDVSLAQAPAMAAGAEEGFSIEATAEALTHLAASGRLGRLDQRDPIVERVLAALAAPGCSSVLLVGPRDVGKSALVGEVVARIAAGEVPPALRDRSVWAISANDLIAGARYTGMWQGRARALIAHARAERGVYVMGDPIGIVDAGRWSESSNNLARQLRPAMESGELSVICETTADALSAATAKEPGFIDAFHRVELREPDAEQVDQILTAASERLSVAHGIEFEPSALTSAVHLTRRFEPYSALPGKAVRLLEQVVQRTVGQDATDTIDQEDVIAAFAERSGLPRSLLSDEVTLDLGETAAFLERRVLGQPAARDAMVDLVAVIKAGLHDVTKPLGSYFFVGPTGVGKTELAKAVAELLFSDRDRMLRFDMGEYQSGDAVAKLIGSGWRDGEEGELTRLVREQPFCVLLLDEIEKAHANVFDALLSVLGEGRLTDSSGRTADFRNTVVIMTSNLGAVGADRPGVGFAGDQHEPRRQRFVEAAENFFRPEFFNRIDQVVVFEPLTHDTIHRIARREIGRLIMREGITRRQLLVEIDDAVIQYCADAGFHSRYGARPLQREIESTISRPLARIVVGERARPGDLISFRLSDGRVTAGLHRPTEAQPQTGIRRGRPAEFDIERASHEVAELRDRLSAQAAEPLMEAIELETDRLLRTTNEPAFWDDPENARSIMSRYYLLDRSMTRFSALRSRADGLTELASAIRRQRDLSRLTELRDAIAEIEAGADFLRLELTGAVGGIDGDIAYVTLTGIGGPSKAWASELRQMYATWAERTGREVRHTETTLEIEGVSSYLLLRAESGLHRLVDNENSSVLARVAVGSTQDNAVDDGATIVRQYYRGRRRFVRDPRTGVRIPDVAAVLERGEIDPFLIAAAEVLSEAR